MHKNCSRGETLINQEQSLKIWNWEGLEVAWNVQGINSSATFSTVLIHGFGGCKEHWRYNQHVLAKESACFCIDLIGFGESSQPKARLKGESSKQNDFCYCFDSWAEQIKAFCNEVVKKPVLLIGNSIGGVVSLRASQILKDTCIGVVLINCAQRAMDDKRLDSQPQLMQWIRPYLKEVVKPRWVCSGLFRNAANPRIIKQVLKQAYPSGNNINKELIEILHKPSTREGASEAFRGFINLFDDYLAPDLMRKIQIPIYLIWGEKDPWEDIKEARNWATSIECIRSLEIIKNAGHCPHDEAPEEVNKLLLKIIQEAI